MQSLLLLLVLLAYAVSHCKVDARRTKPLNDISAASKPSSGGDASPSSSSRRRTRKKLDTWFRQLGDSSGIAVKRDASEAIGSCRDADEARSEVDALFERWGLGIEWIHMGTISGREHFDKQGIAPMRFVVRNLHESSSAVNAWTAFQYHTWSTCFHGTAWQCVRKIFDEGLKPGKRAQYGYGIYCGNLSVAETFAAQASRNNPPPGCEQEEQPNIDICGFKLDVMIQLAVNPLRGWTSVPGKGYKVINGGYLDLFTGRRSLESYYRLPAIVVDLSRN